jgi:acyl carrier protein
MVMTEQEILSCLAKIVEEFTGIPASKVTPEASIVDDLQISSLSMVEIIVAAQDEYDIDIPDTALKDLRTFGDVVSYVGRAQSAEAAAT